MVVEPGGTTRPNRETGSPRVRVPPEVCRRDPPHVGRDRVIDNVDEGQDTGNVQDHSQRFREVRGLGVPPPFREIADDARVPRVAQRLMPTPGSPCSETAARATQVDVETAPVDQCQ
ncbi:hypothetical protein KPB2_5344 [Klebsiella pneumoniae Kb677]|nr:hypothetical protein KPB2_5344 [Klebsiella pneumoniae Kb677]